MAHRAGQKLASVWCSSNGAFLTQINAARDPPCIDWPTSFHKGSRYCGVDRSRMEAGAIMRIQLHPLLFRIGAAIFLFGVIGSATARADETVDKLNHLGGDYEISVRRGQGGERRVRQVECLSKLDYYLGKVPGMDSRGPPPPTDYDEFLRNAPRHDALEAMVPVLDQACDKARQTYGQALGEAMLTNWWLEELPTSANVAKPSTSPNAPGAATDQQCSKLSKKAGVIGAFGGLGDLADRLGKKANSKAHEIAGYRRALALYRQGAARCKQACFPALFVKRIRETEQSLRKLGVMP